MMKQLIHALSSICLCCMLMFAPTMGVSAQALASEGKSISLYAENCNIKVATTNKKEISVDYNQTFFQVKQETKGEQSVVSIIGNNTSKKDLVNVATVYIPETMLNLPISMNSVSAGISVDAMNANLNLNGTNAAVSFSIPANLTNNITCTMKDSAFSAFVSEKSTNYSLNVQINNSAMSLPEEWGIATESTYKRVEGNGATQINISADNCAFSLKMEDAVKK